jgi:hypothetical protein
LNLLPARLVHQVRDAVPQPIVIFMVQWLRAIPVSFMFNPFWMQFYLKMASLPFCLADTLNLGPTTLALARLPPRRPLAAHIF